MKQNIIDRINHLANEKEPFLLSSTMQVRKHTYGSCLK